MSIKQKLIIIEATSLTAVAILGTMLYSGIKSLDFAMEKSRISTEIIKKVFDRRIFLNDYLEYHIERPEKQWEISHNSLKNFVTTESVKFTEPREIAIINSIQELLKKDRDVFIDLINIHKKISSNFKTKEGIYWEKRLTNQLLIFSQSLISLSEELSKINEKNALNAHKKIAYILGFFVISLLLFSISTVTFLWKSILNPITLLQKGTKRIGSGDFSYKVDTKKKDEIGELSREFDEMAEKLATIDQAKNEFVSLASHQLRTPLTTISWYTEMILSGDAGKLSKKIQLYLEEIYKGNRNIVELVNTLLDVSRIELGKLSPQYQETKVIEIAEELLEEQAPRIRNKKLAIVKRFEEDAYKFYSDPKLLRMVLQNILTNAIEYTPENGRIEFSLMIDEDNDLFIQISDTGYGIPKHQQNKIFTKLFRADNVRAKDTVGTGLGLYIVKSIVENSKGKVWFESEENKGSTFFVKIPPGKKS